MSSRQDKEQEAPPELSPLLSNSNLYNSNRNENSNITKPFQRAFQIYFFCQIKTKKRTRFVLQVGAVLYLRGKLFN